MATASSPLPPPPLPLLTHPPSRFAAPSPPINVILTFVVVIFFFATFFSIYFCRCFYQNMHNSWFTRHNPPSAPPVDPVNPAPGLDPEIVKLFPTFDYSSVKGYRREKYGLECAICLIEFVHADVLRFITACCHVFHQECIDLWLESHKTCPVCRRELDLIESPIKPCPLMRDIQEEEEDRDTFVITIKDDATSSGNNIVRQKSGGYQEESMVEKFSKSHSTGHSVVIGNISSNKKESDDDQDRYTLRLPEHVKSHIIKAHHSATRSCTQFGDLKSRSNKGSIVLAEVCGDQDINQV